MIDYLGGFIQKNLIVFMAIVLLPLKWVVVRLCRDREGEAVALMSVPEDLCYVALGLVMGDIINSAGALHRYFAGSNHLSIDMLITVAINLIVAFVVHRMSQSCTKQFRLWRAADEAKAADNRYVDQLQLPQHPTVADGVHTLMLRHLALFSLGYAFQLMLVLIWLHWIAKVVANAL
jgi:hypothetical protein